LNNLAKIVALSPASIATDLLVPAAATDHKHWSLWGYGSRSALPIEI